jgi:hypothetical protein
MEKVYSLKNIRSVPGLDGTGLSAAIYLGHRRIGVVHDHSDDGKIRFEFEMFTDRIVFEQFLETWWARESKDQVPDLVSAEFAYNDPAFVPSLQARMRYWIRSMVNAAAWSARARRTA